MSRDRTEWRCPVCFARGSIEHSPNTSTAAISALVKTAHCVVQPRCAGTPAPISGTQTALPWPPKLRTREDA